MNVSAVLSSVATSLQVEEHALPDALNIPAETIKTWKHRGAIPASRLLELSTRTGLSVESLIGEPSATGAAGSSLPTATEETEILLNLVTAIRTLPTEIALPLLRHALGMRDELTFCEEVFQALGLRADFADRLTFFR